MSTIVAIASPPGPGSRGVIRVSGPRARELANAVMRFDDTHALARRGAWRGRFDDGRGTLPATVLWMPGPHSYTREDVVEFHVPGSPPLVQAALARLISLGAEPARAGEFTRRAFENGRIDLTRAEGVLALIEAATDAERRAASLLLFGGLQQRVADLREGLLDLRVLCEASLDFDEADTGHVPLEELETLGRVTIERLDEALTWEQRRARSSHVPRIALAGAPNAGKSTLFNVLTGGRALVSDLPGTTRDAVRGTWRVHGFDCELIDTAGLDDDFARRAAHDDPDRVAQRLSRAEHEGADVVLYLVDVREPRIELRDVAPYSTVVVVRTQIDRVSAVPNAASASNEVLISAIAGRGLVELGDAVARALGLTSPTASGSSAGRELSERHLDALRRSRALLSDALAALGAGAPLDLVAEALRSAVDALDEIDGRTSPEDLLGRLFARFCVGK